LLPPLALLLLLEDEAPDDELLDELCFGAPPAACCLLSEPEPPGEPPAAAELPPGAAANTGPPAPPGLATDIGATAAANRTAELDARAGLPDSATAEIPVEAPAASQAPTIHTSAAPPRSNVTGPGRRDNTHRHTADSTRDSTSSTTESTTRTRRPPAETTDTITSTPRDHRADTATPGTSTEEKNRRTFHAHQMGHDHAALDTKTRRMTTLLGLNRHPDPTETPPRSPHAVATPKCGALKRPALASTTSAKQHGGRDRQTTAARHERNPHRRAPPRQTHDRATAPG
jgi:hypothetical protein